MDKRIISQRTLGITILLAVVILLFVAPVSKRARQSDGFVGKPLRFSPRIRQSLRMWDVTNGRQLLALPPERTGYDPPIAFGEHLIAAGGWDGVVLFWRFDPRLEQVSEFEAGTIGVSALAFSPNQKFIAVGARNGDVQLWTVDPPRTAWTPTQPADVTTPVILKKTIKVPWAERIAISPDSRTLAAAGYTDPSSQPHRKVITIRDLEKNRMDTTLTEFKGSVNSLAFSPTGSLLVTGDNGNDHSRGPNGADGTLKLWDVHSGRLVRTFVGLEGSVIAVAFSPRGTIVGSIDFGKGGGLKLWSIKTGSLLKRLIGHSENWQLVFSPGGNTLAAGEGLWNVNTGVLTQIPTQQYGPLAFSSDGRILAITARGSAVEKRILKLWDVHRNQFLRTLGESTDCVSISFSPDNKRLAAACLKPYASNPEAVMVKLWNVDDGTLIANIDSPGVSAVLFSNDNNLLTFGPVAAPNAVVKVWDISRLK